MEFVATDKAPKALGAYSQAVKSGGMVYCSGQLGINPATSKLLEGVGPQAQQALENLEHVLKEANSSIGKVVKATIFLNDMGDFQTVNEIYSRCFGDHRPARACVQAAALPAGGLVEIECIAEQ